MANYGTTTHRPSTTNPPPSPINDGEPKDSSQKNPYTITLSFPFDIPPTPESAAARIVKNLKTFSLYYATFVWTVLFIALIPARKVSVVYLVATTEVAFLYSLLLRAHPGSHRLIDKRIVFVSLFVVAAVEMILTEAALHLFLVLAATLPIVMLHAALSKTDVDASVDDQAEELARLAVEKVGGIGGAQTPENFV